MTGPIGDIKPKRVLPRKAREFANARLLMRDTGQPVANNVMPDQDKLAFEAALAKAKPVLDAAERVLAVRGPGQKVMTAGAGYVVATRALKADLDRGDHVAALATLQNKEVAAKAVLKAKGLDDAAVLKQQQIGAQIARYDAMAGTMEDVKRSYLPDGGAAQIGKLKLGKDQLFERFVTALQTLETAKKGLDPADPVPAPKAAIVKGNCDGVIAAARAWLVQFGKLDANAQAEKENQTRKRLCEENILAARHYGMAMELDAAGKPSADAPWDLETAARVSGLEAAFSYEQGYAQAKGLKGGGASTSFWIQSKDVDPATGELAAKGRNEYIFKPAAGEAFPDGVYDRKGAGAAKEALASSNAKLFAAQTGIDLGVPETSVVSVGQHAREGGNPAKPAEIGSAQKHANASTELRDLPPAVLANVKREDIHKIALIDIMSLTVDRHGGNIMVNADDPDNPRLVPIDHGGSLPSRADFSQAKCRMGGLNFGGRVSDVVNTLLMSPAAYENFDPETVAKLDLLDPAAMEQGMKDQRDALGKVHPGLDPASKVGDDSFHMAKRSMMFLKRAARTLSPAEIQIALAAHGEALFDAADNAFDTLADQVIAEQAPKKGAYQEVMAATDDERTTMCLWLSNNGWALALEAGANSASDLMMRDPVNALKLYKARRPNPAPLVPAGTPKSPKPPTGTESPDDLMKEGILKAVPALAKKMENILKKNPPEKENLSDDAWKEKIAIWKAKNKKASDDAWKENYAIWKAISAITVDGKGPVRALEAAVAATGAKPPTDLDGMFKGLVAWEEINKPQNAQALAALVAGTSSKSLEAVLRGALALPANRQLATQQLAQVATTGATIAPDDALRAGTRHCFVEIGQITVNFKDPAQKIAFNNRADAIMARSRTNDFAAAEAEMRALKTEALKYEVDELNRLTIDMIDRLIALVPTVTLSADYGGGDEATYLATLAKKRGEAEVGKDVVFARIRYTDYSKDAAELPLACPPKPGGGVAQPTAPQQAVPDNTAAQQDDADTGDTGDDDDDTAVPANPLAAFSWNPKAASAAKKQAVQARLFKDKDTGMTAALKPVLAARKALDGLKADAGTQKRLAAVEKARAAYGVFGIFVASKLRILSRDPAWWAYCDSASDLVQTEIGALKTREAAIRNGTGT